MKNIYNSDNQPLYTTNSSDNNNTFYNSNSSKNLLLNNQNDRCLKCQNVINITDSYMVYTNPLKYGGENSITNLSLLIEVCWVNINRQFYSC